MMQKTCNTIVDEKERDISKHGDTKFPIACFHYRLALEPVPWHWHEEWEAVVVEQGSASFSVNGQRYALGTGEGIFVNSSALHAAWDAGDTDCRLRSVVFHPGLLGEGLDSASWQDYVQKLLSNDSLKGAPLTPDVPWNREALRCIETAWTACEEERPGFESETRTALSRLVFLLASHCPAESGPPDKKALRCSERTKTMLQFIQTHYAEPLSIADIAKSAAVSESECLRCFREILGTSPIHYLRLLRIQRAEELLRTTDLKIAAIGAACGFKEMSYFSKSFRQVAGCTPKAFRDSLGERPETPGFAVG